MNEQSGMLPPKESLTVGGNGNPLQMRGLCHVVSACYEQGMTLDELQAKVGSAVQKELSMQLQAMDPASAKVVMEFLKTIDNGLTLDYNRDIVDRDVDVITGKRTL